MRPNKPILTLALMLVVTLTGGLVSGCSASPVSGSGPAVRMAPMQDMPAEVQAAAVPVQQAYRYAVANPHTLTQIPCYCGCGSMGHTSNYACYVSGTDASGKPSFDHHALGCSICVDITQDVIRLQQQGASVPDIRSYVDGKYAQYGPSNIP